MRRLRQLRATLGHIIPRADEEGGHVAAQARSVGLEVRELTAALQRAEEAAHALKADLVRLHAQWAEAAQRGDAPGRMRDLLMPPMEGLLCRLRDEQERHGEWERGLRRAVVALREVSQVVLRSRGLEGELEEEEEEEERQGGAATQIGIADEEEEEEDGGAHRQGAAAGARLGGRADADHADRWAKQTAGLARLASQREAGPSASQQRAALPPERGAGAQSGRAPLKPKAGPEGVRRVVLARRPGDEEGTTLAAQRPSDPTPVTASPEDGRAGRGGAPVVSRFAGAADWLEGSLRRRDAAAAPSAEVEQGVDDSFDQESDFA